MNGKLIYCRKALKTLDGKDGLLYVHSWATGYQHLIFSTKESAESFATNEQLEIVS